MKTGRATVSMAVITVLCVAAITTVIATTTAAREKADPDPIKSLAAGNTAFAVDLYGKIRGNAGNIFLSPYSISSALGMIKV